ncbi:MAG: four helix bundle protein [Planctomycetota bacterium]
MKKPWDMRERTLDFAVRVLDIVERLPRGVGPRKVAGQLAESGTSIGANYHEADTALTGPDKRKSLVTSRKEAQETSYWLKIVQRKWGTRVEVGADIEEVGELVAILNRMINNLDKRIRAAS